MTKRSKNKTHALQTMQNSTDVHISCVSYELKEIKGSEREEKSRYPKIRAAFCLARACIWILPGHASGLLRGAELASSFCFICSVSALPGLTRHEEEAVQRVYREKLPDSSSGYMLRRGRGHQNIKQCMFRRLCARVFVCVRW